jgi:hypothetical protein
MNEMQSESDKLRAFLEQKFACADGFVTVWTKANRMTKAFPTTHLDGAIAFIEDAASNDDVYVAISTQTAAPALGKRGNENTVDTLTGLFADIDFATAKGAQTGYPTDEAEALEILKDFPLKPTSLIASGNGLQAHFDFDTPLRIQSDADRVAAKTLSTDFQRILIAHFRAHGRKIDSVGDLVRNFRPPGTRNHKSNPPKAVVLLEHDPARRYEMRQIQALLAEKGQLENSRKTARCTNEVPLADHSRVVTECAWYRDVVVEGAAACAEPDWFAGASISALCKDGENIFLAYSRQHPNFNEREAREKFRRAVEHNSPRTCDSIASDLGHRSVCERCVHQTKISTPLQLGRDQSRPERGGRRALGGVQYDPGEIGPIPLGCMRDGSFAVRDQVRQIIILLSANQLLSFQSQVGLAPIDFWQKQFPGRENSRSLFDSIAVGEALIGACKRSGPFNPQKVRGRGVWLENEKVIVNLGDPIPGDAQHQYLCFEPLPVRQVKEFDVARLKAFLELFNFRNPQDAQLLFGWLTIAPICGALERRPHCFIYGPPNCGKTTLHTLAYRLLTPLVVSTDGQSSEAGIRQTMGPDSLPVIIDEFESDQVRGNLGGVLRLARSAYSSETPVLRGTPEGKALVFCLRATFLFAAVNPAGLSQADESRIFQIEMIRHESSPDVAKQIASEETFFADKGPYWCGYMAGLASLIPPAIDEFRRALPGLESRHRQNLATLLAGAFVALNRAIPSAAEATTIAQEFSPTIAHHAEPFERDDALECLDHLFSHQVDNNETLGNWIMDEAKARQNGNQQYLTKARELRNFDIVIRGEGNEPGLFLMNGSSAIDRVFDGTIWARGGWKKALRKIDGYFTPANPIHFASVRRKARAIGLPLDLIPEASPKHDGSY